MIRFGIGHTARVGSVLATLNVTIERLIAVVCPLRRMRKTTSIMCMTASFIVTVVYNIPRFFEIKTITIQSSSDDENVQVSIMNTKILDLSNVFLPWETALPS